MKTLIIFHAGCMDGLFAAYAIRHACGSGVEYCPANYGDEPPPLLDEESGKPKYKWVYVVDFSYPRDTLETMNQVLDQRLTVIDHHKTAEEDLHGIPYAIFDMDRSGARLAWDYTHDTPAPWPVRYVEDRDLWKFELESSEEINAVLRNIFSDQLRGEDIDGRYREFFSDMCGKGGDLDAPSWVETIQDHMEAVGGCLLLESKQEVIKQAGRAEVMRVALPRGGDAVAPFINTEYKVSETLHYLLDCGVDMSRISTEEPWLDYLSESGTKPGFAVAWFKVPGKYVFSLRGSTTDVASIAKALGGGGHPKAAGFTVPHDDIDGLHKALNGIWDA